MNMFVVTEVLSLKLRVALEVSNATKAVTETERLPLELSLKMCVATETVTETGHCH